MAGLGDLRESYDEGLAAINFNHGEISNTLSVIQEQLDLLRNSSRNGGVDAFSPTLSAITALLKEILTVH